MDDWNIKFHGNGVQQFITCILFQLMFHKFQNSSYTQDFPEVSKYASKHYHS